MQNLEKNLQNLAPSLFPIQQKLVSVKRQMTAVASKKTFNASEFEPLLEELRAIEAKKVDGVFKSPNGEIPHGQEILLGLLDECFTFAEDVRVREGDVAPELKPIYEKLSVLKGELEKLTLTHRWTLREPDLYHFQNDLNKIDKMRSPSGKFVVGDKVPEGQAVRKTFYFLKK